MRLSLVLAIGIATVWAAGGVVFGNVQKYTVLAEKERVARDAPRVYPGGALFEGVVKRNQPWLTGQIRWM